MKKILVLALLGVLSINMFGCNKNEEIVETVEQKIESTNIQETKKVEETTVIEEANEQVEENDIEKGKYMFIKLKTNPTTGFDYVWEIANEGSTGFVNLEDTIVERNNNGMAGAPIYRTYVFNAEPDMQGDVVLDFHYKRNWEGGEDAYHIYYTVNVDDEGKISFKDKKVESVNIEANINDFSNPMFADSYNIETSSYDEEPEE